MNVFRYKNYVYLPILKNASSTYINFFTKNGWEETSEDVARDNPDTILFGHIQHPNIRHSKGVAEIIIERDYESLLEDKKTALLLCSGLYDLHTYPVGLIFGEIVLRTHWIPMDLVIDGKPISCHSLTNLFFKENNLPFFIDNSYNINIADIEKQKIQNKVKEIKEKYHDEVYPWIRSGILRHDLWFWENSIEYYKKYLQSINYNE